MIDIKDIPETIQLSETTVYPRQRLVDFLNGTCQPVGKVWVADFIRWVEYEGIPSLSNFRKQEQKNEQKPTSIFC